MNSERIQNIINQLTNLNTNVFSIETEYNLTIKNKVGEIKSTANIFKKAWSEEVILTRLAYDLAIIKNMTTNYIDSLNDDIDGYEFDAESNFDLTFKISNGVLETTSNNHELTSIDIGLAYNEFFEALKRYLVAIALEGEYNNLTRITDFIAKMTNKGIYDFYNFVSWNIDLYSDYDLNYINRIQRETNPIPAFADFKHYQNNDSDYNTDNYDSIYIPNQKSSYNQVPYSMRKNNGMCVAAFVMGILTIFFWRSIFIPILALIFGIKGTRAFDEHTEKNRSFGTIGMVIGIIYLIPIVLLIVLPLLFYATS